MKLFDFFFPAQAQAAHLRELAAQNRAQALAWHRERLAQALSSRLELTKAGNLEQRVEQLERELGQAALTIEALLELLEERGAVSREALRERVGQIDVRDGVADGRVTPERARPFKPNRPWPGGEGAGEEN